jgi:hypothetical protein
MDPDEALKKIRAYIVAAAIQGHCDDADEALEAFEALDHWMRRGFPPKDWDPKCGAPAPGERVRCLLRPGHAGSHRHDTPNSSRAWS